MAEEPIEQNISEFNMSVSYLNRLNQWFYLAGESSLRLDSFNWFHGIMLIFRELSTEAKEEIIIMTKDNFVLAPWIKNKISKLNEKVVNNQISCMNTKRVSIPQDLWFELMEFELYQRKICKDSGLQIKMREIVDIKGL